MLWFRRFVAMCLAFILVLLFIPMLVIFRINDTLGNPDFYTDQLRRADVYNSIHTDILPAVLEKAEMGDVNLAWVKPHLLGIIQQTLPPEWLQAQTEQVIPAVLPYVLGDTPGFNVNTPLKDRVEAAARAVRDTLHQEGVTPKLYDLALDSMMVSGLPLPLSKGEIKAMVRVVLPPEWVLKQLDNAIDEVLPYFTKEKEHFLLRINLLERLETLKSVLIDILRKPEAYDYICREVVARLVKQNLQQAQLPAGLTLTDAEILSVVKQVLPLEWYRALVPEMVGAVFSYLSGARPDLELLLPLADHKSAIAQVLSRLVDQKLESQVNALPVCTLAQVASLLMNPLSSSLPLCRPAGVSYAELKKLLGINVDALLTPLISRALPDQIRLSEAELRQAMGSTDGANPLAQAREQLQKGLTFSDEDLRARLGPNQGKMEDIRQWIARGFTFTEQDLRSWLSAGGGSEQLQSWDSLRSGLGTARRWKSALWLLPALLLGAIGVLGGRRWSSKLMWASMVLALTAFMAYVIFGPLFSAMAQPSISRALTPAVSLTDPFQMLIAGRGAIIAQNAIDSFIGGIKSQAMALLVFALALMVLGSVWHLRRK